MALSDDCIEVTGPEATITRTLTVVVEGSEITIEQRRVQRLRLRRLNNSRVSGHFVNHPFFSSFCLKQKNKYNIQVTRTRSLGSLTVRVPDKSQGRDKLWSDDKNLVQYRQTEVNGTLERVLRGVRKNISDRCRYIFGFLLESKPRWT